MDNKKYGLIIEEKKPEEYVFGASPVPFEEINPSGDWSKYLPKGEVQNLEGFETYACVCYTILNCIEILLNKMLIDGKFTRDDILRYVEKGFIKKIR